MTAAALRAKASLLWWDVFIENGRNSIVYQTLKKLIRDTQESYRTIAIDQFWAFAWLEYCNYLRSFKCFRQDSVLQLLDKKLLKITFFAFMNIFEFLNKENNISIKKDVKIYINKDFEVSQYISLRFT